MRPLPSRLVRPRGAAHMSVALCLSPFLKWHLLRVCGAGWACDMFLPWLRVACPFPRLCQGPCVLA